MGDRVQGLPGDRIVPHAVKYRRAIAGIDRDELAKRLTKATGDAWTKTMIVNLENQRRVVSVGLDYVTVTATDLETTIRVTIPADVDDATGEPVNVDRKAFAAAVKAGADTVTVSRDGDADGFTGLTVTNGAGTVTVPVASLIEDTVTFPRLEAATVGEHGFLSDGDRDTLARVAHAAATDGARPILTGVYFADGTVAATDSYRLAFAPLESYTGPPTLIPAHVIRTVTRWKVDGQVAVSVDTHGDVLLSAILEGGSKRAPSPYQLDLRVRPIEGQFPNTERLIPDTCDAATVLDSHALTDQLKAAVATVKASGKANVPVRVTWSSDTAGVSLAAPECAMNGTVPVLEHTGDTLEAAYNPSYLLAAVGAVDGDGTVRVESRDALKPIVLSSSSSTVRTLLMPMRIS